MSRRSLPVVALLALGASACSSSPTTPDAGGDGGVSDAAPSGDADATPEAGPAAFRAVKISAGGHHTCAIEADGTLWCWGQNQFGQLGDGATQNQGHPVQVVSLGNVVAEVSAGELHTCARKTDDTLWCWGYDGYGQLGQGSQSMFGAPVQVQALGNSVAQVSSGYGHTCALKTDGTLWCWGHNDHGQLGSGTTSDIYSPTQVTALGNTVAQVSAGEWHTCAKQTDGSAWCWGDNTGGQLGDGTMTGSACSGSCKPSPVQITALGTNTAALAAGGFHTCAIKSDATLWCCGFDLEGQLGDGTNQNNGTPVPVTTLGASVAQVSGGEKFTCARKSDDTLWCWGYNFLGQLGMGGTQDQNTPQASDPGATVTAVSTGLQHTCARHDDDSVWCWGNGYLGDSAQQETKSDPVQVTPGP